MYYIKSYNTHTDVLSDVQNNASKIYFQKIIYSQMKTPFIPSYKLIGFANFRLVIS